MRMSSQNCGRWLAIAAGVVSVCWVNPALATSEILGLSDTRSTAMAGTGTSFLQTPSVASRNPALLQATELAALYFAVGPALALFEAPVDGPNQSKKTSATISALPSLAGSLRIHERLVVGLNVQLVGGSAGTYENAGLFGGRELSALNFSAEAAPAVSVKLLDNLWLGASYRISYLSNTVKIPLATDSGAYEISKTSIDKLHAGGYGLGLYYEPIKHLRFGAAFRSQILATGHGDTSFAGSTLKTSQTVSSPASLRGGVAYGFMNDRLLTALEVRWEFYSQSNRELITRVHAPTGRVESITQQRWQDGVLVQVGGEYWVDDAHSWCLRAGYAGGQEQVRKQRPNFYTTGGFMHYATLGAGVKAGRHWQVDAALLAEFPHGFTSNAPRADAGVPPGRYGQESYVLSVAGTYFFGGRPMGR